MSAHQKVVYAGIKRVSEDQTIRRELYRYWQKEFSAKAFDVIATVNGMVDYFGFGAREKKLLLVGMHAASNKAAIELEEVPHYMLDGGEVDATLATERAEEIKTAHRDVTEAFATQAGKKLRRLDASRYNELIQILSDEGLPKLEKEISSCVRKSPDMEISLPKDISEKGCQAFAHELYLLIIEVFGPVDSDVVVDAVISELLDMSAATRFDPRTLL